MVLILPTLVIEVDYNDYKSMKSQTVDESRHQIDETVQCEQIEDEEQRKHQKHTLYKFEQNQKTGTLTSNSLSLSNTKHHQFIKYVVWITIIL